MKNIAIVVYILTFVLTASALSAQKLSSAPEGYDIIGIDTLYQTDPHKALRLADSLHNVYLKEGFTPPNTKEYLELVTALIYLWLNQFRLADYYAQEAVAAARISRNQEIELKAINMLAEISIQLNDDQKAAYWSKELDERNLKGNEGYVWYKMMSLYFDGINRIKAGEYQGALKSLSLAKKYLDDTLENRINFSSSLAIVAAQALELIGQREEAIKELQVVIDELEQLEPRPYIKRTGIDARRLDCYTAIMNLLVRSGRASQAMKYYDKVLVLSRTYPKRNYVKTNISSFLLSMHLYKEAEHYIAIQLEEMKISNDTLSTDALAMLRMFAETKQKIGKTDEACELYRHVLIVNDTIMLRERQQALMEYSVINQLQDYKLAIKEQESLLHTHRFFILTTIIVLCISGVLLYIIILRLNKLKTRNFHLQTSFDMQRSAEMELKRLYDIAQGNPKENLESTACQTKNDDLQVLDEWLNENQRYLQKEITIEQAVQKCRLDKKVLTDLLRSVHGMKFSDYLSEKRLDYACKRLKDLDNATLDAIAEESGFNSTRTFLRRFRDKYGMSPTEWRNLVKAVGLLADDGKESIL